MTVPCSCNVLIDCNHVLVREIKKLLLFILSLFLSEEWIYNRIIDCISIICNFSLLFFSPQKKRFSSSMLCRLASSVPLKKKRQPRINSNHAPPPTITEAQLQIIIKTRWHSAPSIKASVVEGLGRLDNDREVASSTPAKDPCFRSRSPIRTINPSHFSHLRAYREEIHFCGGSQAISMMLV